MPIRYKVVDSFRNSYPGRAIKLHYSKGEVVEPRALLGIFVFKRKKDAKDYIDLEVDGQDPTLLQILRVQTIGKGRKRTCCPYLRYNTTPYPVIDSFLRAELSNPKEEYHIMENTGLVGTLGDVQVWWCAEGTMTYPSVLVLD